MSPTNSSLDQGDNKNLSNQEYRRKAQDAAFHSYGTYIIFKTREAQLNKYLRRCCALNILVPSLLGTIYICFGVNLLGKDFCIAVTTVLSFFLMAMTLVAYLLKWQEKWYESRQNMIDNYCMYEKYKDIADDLTLNQCEFESTYNKFKIDSKYIDKRSVESEITDREKIFGHRNALIQFRRKCASCGKVPEDMNPTPCLICGQFKRIIQ